MFIFFKKYFNNILNRNSDKTELKKKWNNLAKKDSKFYIWSSEGHMDDQKYQESGKKHVEEYILKDNFIKKLLNNAFCNLTVLELGCGNGRMSEFIGRNCKKLYALDISKQMVLEAKKRLPKLNNIIFLEIDGKKFPESINNSIDFAFSFLVFQHIPTYKMVEKYFREITKSLKKDGIFKVQLRGKEVSKKTWYYGVHYDLQKAKVLCAKTGFQILKYNGVGKRYFWLWLKKTS